MPKKIISDEIKERVKKLYKQRLTNQEIANLVGLTAVSVNNIIKPFILSGELEPKKASLQGRKITPKGQGKGAYVKKGYNPANKKLSPEQEKDLLIDYFENNMTYKDIMIKYHLWQGSIKLRIDKAIRQGLYSHKRQDQQKGEK